LKPSVTKPFFLASAANFAALSPSTFFCEAETLFPTTSDPAILAAPESAAAAGLAAAGAAAGLVPKVIAAGASGAGEEAAFAPNKNPLDEALESTGLAPKEKLPDTAGADVPKVKPDAAGGAAADAPKPPEDNPDPPAGAVVPNVKPFEVVVPVAAGALVPNWKDGATTEELAAAAAFVPNENVAPPALPPTAA